ncbi:lytic transglycosylase domain-containing protein [Granulicella sp. WH15]|uniref:lytic transglycosylase domain-containing protein n=1 Tax=Granulicella sp. WH15 TaxID=2602070 RepID=UPI0013676A4B|nr:lytic transglycosylase domain-containing protein [Granulicella sp. WH15]QHN02524.1 lytic transglycosylase domain-containing protein [Granulicella sp. WH15]
MSGFGRGQIGLALAFVLATPLARAAEHVTLKNGQEFDHVVRREADGDRARLYLTADNYVEVAAGSVDKVEVLEERVEPPVPEVKTAPTTAAQIQALVAKSGAEHRIDTDLLASVIKAESGGRALAVSRTGARGLMQLMPGTAATLGVKDAFLPDQNIAGGTAYLDQLLTRYKDDLQRALAAYNAGPGAVDKYHGVPPFPETREYVRRVILEYNRRKLALQDLALKTKLVAAQ